MQDWLVGASERADAVARRFEAERLTSEAAVYRVPRELARGFADALAQRRLLDFAEPDRRLQPSAFPADPLSAFQWAPPAVRADKLTPPPVGRDSALLAVIEPGFDPTHPEWQGAPLSFRGTPVVDAHGTEVASVAGAPANSRGMVGLWPGMRMLISYASERTCGSAVRAIDRAVRAGAWVINMSYGFADGCFAHRVATNEAYGAGTALVAAAGNDFGVRDAKYDSPAGDPHVITVTSVDRELVSSRFSNAFDAVDVSAPGEGVLAAVPLALDDDGVRDGYGTFDGTSAAAPVVAALASWVWDRRRRLDQTQLTDLVRHSARDLGVRGWDKRYGFGITDLPRALAARAPARDPIEPNDDIEWVNGRHFRRDPPVYRGRPRAVRARVDQREDPADVYGVRLPTRSTLRLRLLPLSGDPDLDAYSRRARTVWGRSGRLAFSYRWGRRTDTIFLTNRSRRRRWAWIDVFATGRVLEADYRLSFRRVHYRPRAPRVP